MEDVGTKQNVFDFITTEENNYQALPVSVSEGYDWNMARHLKLSLLYKVSQYETGNKEGTADEKPFMNIMRPILNLHYRAEGFDVKDIVLFVNSAKIYYKSFLIKKYHEKWARENKIDTFIDDMVESYVDFGGALLKNTNQKSPEVVPLQRIAFCDQTDILSGPICEKHFYSPDQLKKMEKKRWENIDELIVLSQAVKDTDQTKKQIKTPGKYIKIYELHGVLPDRWLDNGEEEDNKYTNQIQIVAFYQTEGGMKSGITLYKGKEKDGRYKFISRDKIFGRALGLGGAEELFEPQVWTNYDIIRIKGMLDAASKVIFQTTDKGFGARNKLRNLENLEVLDVAEGKKIDQINTTPVNIRLFENSIIQWSENARQIGAANETVMGDQPPAGTPFKLQELITAEAHSLHEYRKGKMATFLGEVWKDWVIPNIAKEINQGQEFISELDLSELQAIVEIIITNESNKVIKEKILKGELIAKEGVETLKQQIRKKFMSGGNKKFLKILKDELKDAPMDVYVNIAGKQKYLSQVTDKLVNVFRQIVVNPAILDDPRMSKLFNQILEMSGLSPIDFYREPQQPQLQPVLPKGAPIRQPRENLTEVLK